MLPPPPTFRRGGIQNHQDQKLKQSQHRQPFCMKVRHVTHFIQASTQELYFGHNLLQLTKQFQKNQKNSAKLLSVLHSTLEAILDGSRAYQAHLSKGDTQVLFWSSLVAVGVIARKRHNGRATNSFRKDHPRIILTMFCSTLAKQLLKWSFAKRSMIRPQHIEQYI